jgi:hypothetical protein
VDVTRAAVADTLLAATNITALIGTYRSVPSIFAQDPVPPQVEGRYIYVSDAVTDSPGTFDTKQTVGRIITHDIGIYEDNAGDPNSVEVVARLVALLFERNPIAVSGYGTALITRVFGPIQAPTDESMNGRIVTVSLDIARQGER